MCINHLCKSLKYVTNVCLSLTLSCTQDDLPTCLQGTDVRVGLWSESYNPDNLPKQLFGKNGSLSSSFFDKLIKSIPLLCMYPDRSILPTELRIQTPLVVTEIENSLRDALLNSDDQYCFERVIGTFNSDFLCHFVKRVALCALLNSKELRGHLSSKTFPVTQLKTDEFFNKEYTSRSFQELFTVGMNDDFSSNACVIRSMIHKTFKDARVPEECIPDIFDLQQPPRLVYRRKLYNSESETTLITNTFPDQQTRNVRRTGLLINEFFVLYPLYSGTLQHYKKKKIIKFCGETFSMLSDLIDRFDLKDEYPSIIEDAITAPVPSQVFTGETFFVNDIGNHLSISDSADKQVLQEGTIVKIPLTTVVQTDSKTFNNICKSLCESNTHVVLQNVLRRKISFSDIFRAHHHDQLMLKSFQKVECDSDLSSSRKTYFMTSNEYAKYLLFNNYITYSDYRSVSLYGIKRLSNLDDTQAEFMNSLSGEFEFSSSSKNIDGCDFIQRKRFSQETLVSNAAYLLIHMNSLTFSHSTL